MCHYPKEYIAQCPFSQLLLTWRLGPGKRRIHIGTLELAPEGDISFSYNCEGLEQAKEYGFSHYTGLPLEEPIDGARALELFLRRVINTKRNDAARLLSFWGITEEMFSNKLYLLGATSGRMHSDEFEFLPVLRQMDKPYNFITDIAGIKYYDLEHSEVKDGSPLKYELERQSSYDKYAVKVMDEQGHTLGYIKQGINRIFYQVDPNLSVIKRSSSYSTSKVYIQITVPAKGSHEVLLPQSK
ncbi:HIRAN domain-containing protein [Porphyromonas sp.]